MPVAQECTDLWFLNTTIIVFAAISERDPLQRENVFGCTLPRRNKCQDRKLLGFSTLPSASGHPTRKRCVHGCRSARVSQMPGLGRKLVEFVRYRGIGLGTRTMSQRLSSRSAEYLNKHPDPENNKKGPSPGDVTFVALMSSSTDILGGAPNVRH